MYNPFYNNIFDQWEFIISSSSSINVEWYFFVTTFPFLVKTLPLYVVTAIPVCTTFVTFSSVVDE